MTADDLAFEALRELSSLKHFPLQIVEGAIRVVMFHHHVQDDASLFLDARKLVVDGLDNMGFVRH